MTQLAEGFNRRMAEYRFRAIKFFLEGDYCLDVGAGKGDIGKLVAPVFKEVDAIEANQEYVDEIVDIGVYGNIWNNFNKSGGHLYNTILAIDVFEHLNEDESQTLRFLSVRNGVVIVVVPNANSLHRRIGKAMGLIKDTTELEQHDLDVGHKRWYTAETLEAELTGIGLTPEYLGGILLKPFPNSEMDKLSKEELDAFYEVGREYPEFCAEVMVVARKT